MMDQYQHLSADERTLLWELLSTDMNVRAVAAQMDRHPSTLYREIKRTYAFDEHPPFRGYFPSVAHRKARRRRGARGNKISRSEDLTAYVVDRLQAAWSPEQIAGYLRRHRAGTNALCHETIYQYVYSAEDRSRDL
jgi:IS30 family transposase